MRARPTSYFGHGRLDSVRGKAKQVNLGTDTIVGLPEVHEECSAEKCRVDAPADDVALAQPVLLLLQQFLRGHGPLAVGLAQAMQPGHCEVADHAQGHHYGRCEGPRAQLPPRSCDGRAARVLCLRGHLQADLPELADLHVALGHAVHGAHLAEAVRNGVLHVAEGAQRGVHAVAGRALWWVERYLNHGDAGFLLHLFVLGHEATEVDVRVLGFQHDADLLRMDAAANLGRNRLLDRAFELCRRVLALLDQLVRDVLEIDLELHLALARLRP
mmetsp:Transcript_32093/g.81661  ORF Transcript_32093/g.81661 Transcript_32093/m.81661 type:complete len:272 (-) Transcript_32093:2802-3617(-)